MAGKKQNMAPMWKQLMKNVIWMNQHHVLPMCIWDALNVNANRMNSLSTTKKCLPHVFLLEQQRNYQGEKLHAKTVAWSYDMEGHAQKCVERYCEIANKKTGQS